jgi:hypothetical protein
MPNIDWRKNSEELVKTEEFKKCYKTNSCLLANYICRQNYDYNFNTFKNMTWSYNSFLENHRLDLVTLICKEYLKIRLIRLYHILPNKKSHVFLVTA